MPSNQWKRRMRQAHRAAPKIHKDAETAVAYYEERDPPKHFVRTFGWLNVVEDYIRRLRNDGINRPWKYFTLPGRNSTDIGLLMNSDLLDKTPDGTLSVAICDHKYADQVVLDLGKFGGVLAYSNRDLDEELEQKYSQIKAHFPFDVINLDLCTPLIPAKQISNLTIIEWVFALQMGQGFLLLLTTRTDPTARDRLLEILTQNLEEPSFRDAYIQEYKTANPDLCVADYTRFTQIVFPKALARWARERGYKTHERFVARYQRSARVQMIAHSLEFEPLGKRGMNKYAPRFKTPPTTLIDRMLNQELTRGVRAAADQAYAEFTSNLLNRNITDIRAELSVNQQLERRLGDESEALGGWYRRA